MAAVCHSRWTYYQTLSTTICSLAIIIFYRCQLDTCQFYRERYLNAAAFWTSIHIQVSQIFSWKFPRPFFITLAPSSEIDFQRFGTKFWDCISSLRHQVLRLISIASATSSEIVFIALASSSKNDFHRFISNCPDTRVCWWRHLGAITCHYSHRSNPPRSITHSTWQCTH